MADHEQHEEHSAPAPPHVDEESTTKLDPDTSQGGEHIHDEAPTTDSVDSSDHGMVSSTHHIRHQESH